VYSANVGDSQTLLVQFDKKLKEEMRKRKEQGEEADKSVYSHQLITVDHIPTAQKESKRIYRHGGEVKTTKNQQASIRSIS
jgi:serine/threonine protein phosphatase PrpC